VDQIDLLDIDANLSMGSSRIGVLATSRDDGEQSKPKRQDSAGFRLRKRLPGIRESRLRD